MNVISEKYDVDMNFPIFGCVFITVSQIFQTSTVSPNSCLVMKMAEGRSTDCGGTSSEYWRRWDIVSFSLFNSDSSHMDFFCLNIL